MNRITAVISLLHQPAAPTSATRRFRREPVLAWTLRRLSAASRVADTALLCWEDQFSAVEPIATAARAFVLVKGPRCPVPLVDAIAAARRWCDGWRGGLLSACHFDLGFHAPWAGEIAQKLQSDAVLLIDPDAALVDPVLLRRLIEHARSHPGIEYCITPAAPGLCGTLIGRPLLERLAEARGYLGRLVNYWPDLPGRDPLTRDECAPVPARLARTTDRFTLDSDRQLELIERATASFNGTLMQTEAEQIAMRLAEDRHCDPLPRDVLLELTTRRYARSVYSPLRHLDIDRPELTPELAKRLFAELSAADDIRLTLAGVGDPLLASDVLDVIAAAYDAGISTVHLETDLLALRPDIVQKLAESKADIVSVHLPALSARVYQAVMGVDALGEVIENIRALVAQRKALSRGTPIVVPTFMKCRENFVEMEAWYDHWLRTTGCAVIAGPSDLAGQIPDPAVADMSPPGRVPCRCLNSRMTVLSDGQVVACEQDVLGQSSLGRIGQKSVQEIWQKDLAVLRRAHAAGQWSAHPLCPSCREWHRP